MHEHSLWLAFLLTFLPVRVDSDPVESLQSSAILAGEWEVKWGKLFSQMRLLFVKFSNFQISLRFHPSTKEESDQCFLHP